MKAAVVSTLLALSTMTAAVAAEDPHHGHAGHAAPKQTAAQAFVALDKNKDGFLSKQEMASHPMTGHFAMMDANKDGKLSPVEFSSM